MWNGSGDQIEIVLLRHGATDGNKRHAYIGRTDETLSDEGKEALLEKRMEQRDFILDKKVRMLFSSPMKRCVETAKVFFPEGDLILLDDLRETDFGDFEGKNYEDLSGNLDYQKWIDSNGELPFPNGESREKVRERTLRVFFQSLSDSESAKEGFDELVYFVHGGTIMTILSELLGKDYYDFQIPNGEGYRCRVYRTDRGFQIKEFTRL